MLNFFVRLHSSNPCVRHARHRYVSSDCGFQNFDCLELFFDNRSSNASAESFNAKIKAFRATFRGVRNVSFFLFRLSNIYA
ncbi:MAG TPA: transposase [Paludibacteraceae bacterium]|nr:transposase [Paludibacteraceae bacterium]